jgi:NAD(P)-dependent dehydrogenase (short-subunit alcohol dehydrogenase family)
MKLKGKVALVTGGSQGAGRAYVLALAREGARVVAIARTLSRPGEPHAPGTLGGIVHEARNEGHEVLGLACDLEREEDINRVVEQVVANYGRIDVLVNNAGIFTHHDGLAMTTAEWDRTMNINVRGAWLVLRAVAPHMIRQRAGSIVSLTSLAAISSERGSQGHVDLSVYAVSKAALNRMTTWFAEELKPWGIAVNAISPGAALTDSWKRIDPAAFEATRSSGKGNEPTPEVLGPPVVYLAQQSAAALTGQILHTNTFGKSWGPGARP